MALTLKKLKKLLPKLLKGAEGTNLKQDVLVCVEGKLYNIKETHQGRIQGRVLPEVTFIAGECIYEGPNEID